MAYKPFENIKTPNQISLESYHKHMQIFSDPNIIRDHELFLSMVNETESLFYYLLQGSGYVESNKKLKDKKDQCAYAIGRERLKLIVLAAQENGYYGETKHIKDTTKTPGADISKG